MREVGRANQNGINVLIVGEFSEISVNGRLLMARLSEFTERPSHASSIFIENANDTRLLQLQDSPNMLSAHHPRPYDSVARLGESCLDLTRAG